MTEMSRILNLPIVRPVSETELEELSAEWIQKEPFEKGCADPRCSTCRNKHGKRVPLRLLPGQAAGIRAWSEHHRLFAGIPVGGGKSALAYLVASETIKRNRHAKVLLLLQPHLVKQFMRVDVPWAWNHLEGYVPRWFNLHGRTAQKRLSLSRADLPGVYVMPYSLLSMEDGPALLGAINADVVIADEAHIMKGKDDSGRQKLFWKWIREKDPRGAVMSGSFNNNTPADYHRIMRWVLAELSPLPGPTIDMQLWAEVMAASSETCPDDLAREMRPLVRWAREAAPHRMTDLSQTPRVVRTAYKIRLRSAPGVVITNATKLDVALRIKNLPVAEPSAKLQAMIDNVETLGEAPDGTVLTYAIEKHRVMRQLANGFYLQHAWVETHPRVEDVRRALLAAKEYRVVLRSFLKTADSRKRGLYIPTAVGNYHKHHGAIEGWEHMHRLWCKWRRRAEGITPAELRAARTTELVLVDDFKIRAIVEWAKQQKPGGIVWTWHTEYAARIHQALVEAGMHRTIRKQQGDEWFRDDGTETRIVVASAEAFGVGKNLQHHSNQLIAEWFRSQWRMEQLLGRTHRTGQKRDVETSTVLKLEHEHLTCRATLLDTVYDKQTFGGSKKLLVADWNPLPEDYPVDFLRERGFTLAQDGSQVEDEDHGSDGSEV